MVLTTTAISWGFSAASWLISPVLTRFLNKCFDALGIDPQFLTRKQILFVKLEKLETTLLPQLLILTDAAQKNPRRPIFEKWLQKLKSAFYEAEHVLGLVEYRRLEKEVNSLFPSTSKFNLKKLKGKLPEFSSEKKNLIKSLENIEEIVNEAMEFVPLLQLQGSRGNNSTWSSNERYRETISTPGSTVIGREKDRDDIVKLLREDFPESSSNSKCYSVIGIWGMGGLGKTTLAQYVCDHEKEVNYFNRVIWAHVSQNFSVHAILRKIWDSAFKEDCPSSGSLEGLQSKLEEKLRGEMYFLVLDDVWCDKGVSEQELEQLFAPLKAGKRGSKILVTTRIEAAAKALGAMNPIPLRELDDEQFMSLFISNAIGDAQISDNHVKERLISIGKKISAKSSRSPLAAKTVADQLRRTLDPDFWLSVLNKSLLKDTMGALFLSYQHLPPPLQRCFAFCSLFPKGHLFWHDHLVNLWIAEGFIETDDSNEHMKDIANRYILELISSSFFQVDEWDRKLYSMHDLMHDLAQNASEGEYFRIESGEKKEIPAHTRHIYVVDHMLGEYVLKICKLKNLRTIIVPKSYSGVILKEVDLDALFTELRKLYVVEIEGFHVKRVPKSVVQLRNLRYLKFGEVEEDTPFISLNRLYQLRTLWISRSRTLWISGQIPDVGRLILLQELKEFHVRMERGFELIQLEHLKNLSGSLSIYGLHNVKTKEEAYRAKLSDKKGLHKLLFTWDYDSGDVLRDNDVEILEGLCPPSQAKELTIEGYSGKRFPSWISENNDNNVQLHHLKFAFCGGLEALDINYLSDLVSLNISFLPRLKSLVSLPLKLTQLEISQCLSLAFVKEEDLDMIMSTKGTRISQIVTLVENSHFKYGYFSVEFQFKHVQEMMKLGDHMEEALSTISKDLKKCLEKRLDLICQLKEVHCELSLPIALQELSIKTCFITDKILAGSLQVLTSLTHLRLEDIITITCIPKEILSSLTNLLNLDITGCLLLRSIGGWDTHSTLKELFIHFCPNLILASSSETIELTSSSKGKKTRFSILKYVTLHYCMPSLGGLSELNNLERLEVMFGCEELKCHSDADKLPPQLKELRISKWSLLEQLVSRDGFSSLFSLELSGAQQEYFSQDGCEVLSYLSSLREIRFDHCKMRSLPNLLCLRSLSYLGIFHCKNLSSLVEELPSVERIVISHCNKDFTRSCKDLNHPNWRKISHIPDKRIM